MRVLLLILLVYWLPSQQEMVLVCKSDGAYAYHNKKCRGLNECTHSIEKVSLAEAIKMGRKPCKYCYPSTLPAVPNNDGQCKAITKKGTRCSRKAGPNGYCWQHGG